MENDLLSLSYLIDAISSLPGVGKKSAKKIAYFLINQDEYYLNKFIDILKNIPNGLSAMIYTQLSDVEDELNGFVTFDREVIKVDPKLIKEINDNIK